MSDEQHRDVVENARLGATLLPHGVIGIDAGMTLTKVARAIDGELAFSVQETAAPRAANGWHGDTRLGLTGARLSDAALASGDVIRVQEIEAAARGVRALLDTEGRLGDGAFVMALLGTGTAFAAVRDGVATHLGGAALGGGSFSGIASRVDPSLSYERMIAGAERGDRRNVDTMIADVYPDGIGRIGPDLTASHLAAARAGSLDDFLAGLLNLHGESIGQIAAARALTARLPRIVLAGGFGHNNPKLVSSIMAMAGLFGVGVETIPAPGFAGALGAALIAAET